MPWWGRWILADPQMLVMDDRGRIWIGRYHNGRPSLLRLYDPDSGSAQRLLLFGTTGAGKSTAGQIILAAMKRSGIAGSSGPTLALLQAQRAPGAGERR